MSDTPETIVNATPVKAGSALFPESLGKIGSSAVVVALLALVFYAFGFAFSNCLLVVVLALIGLYGGLWLLANGRKATGIAAVVLVLLIPVFMLLGGIFRSGPERVVRKTLEAISKGEDLDLVQNNLAPLWSSSLELARSEFKGVIDTGYKFIPEALNDQRDGFKFEVEGSKSLYRGVSAVYVKITPRKPKGASYKVKPFTIALVCYKFDGEWKIAFPAPKGILVDSNDKVIVPRQTLDFLRQLFAIKASTKDAEALRDYGMLLIKKSQKDHAFQRELDLIGNFGREWSYNDYYYDDDEDEDDDDWDLPAPVY